MKKWTKIACAVGVVVLIAVVLVSTGVFRKQEVSGRIVKAKPFWMPEEILRVDKGIVAENDKYVLSWDPNKNCVLLTDKSQGCVWSNIPYDYYLLEETEGYGKVNCESPILIDYIDVHNKQIKKTFGFVECTLNGDTACELIKNGIRVTYYCPDIEIYVPVEYLLFEDGMEARLLISELGEGVNPIYGVTLAPYMCSAKVNSDSYLMIPSGSGALMDVDAGKRPLRTFSGRVYGNDLSLQRHEQVSNEAQVNLPVFGVKSGEYALTAVIDQGAEIAEIHAAVGEEEIEYANVCCEFLIRGIDEAMVTGSSGYKNAIVKQTDGIVDLSYASVKYYPQPAGKADYVGMAETYRNYLKEKFQYETKVSAFSPYCIRTLGAGKIAKNFLGVPYEKVISLSTFEQTKTMIEQLSAATGYQPTVQMIGYGESGMDFGEIAGGFDTAGCLGSNKEFTNLLKYCDRSGVDIFMDYDLLSFAQSGEGLNTLQDATKTANGIRATRSYYLPTTYGVDDEKNQAYLVLRTKYPDVSDRVFKVVKKKKISGISLSSIGKDTYSDFSNPSCFAKCGFPQMVLETFRTAEKKGLKIATTNANDYAAVYSDYVIGTPTSSSQNIGFIKDIPFYQIVFKGINSVSVSPLNLLAEPRMEFLNAMETGSPLCYTLAYDTSADYVGAATDIARFCDYRSLKSTILKDIAESADYLKAVNDAGIVAHEELAYGITKTTFSNGISVVVNKTSADYDFSWGTVSAMNFLYVKGKEQ